MCLSARVLNFPARVVTGGPSLLLEPSLVRPQHPPLHLLCPGRGLWGGTACSCCPGSGGPGFVLWLVALRSAAMPALDSKRDEKRCLPLRGTLRMKCLHELHPHSAGRCQLRAQMPALTGGLYIQSSEPARRGCQEGRQERRCRGGCPRLLLKQGHLR